MEFSGKVKDGVVVFDEKTPLKDGTPVRIQTVQSFFERYRHVIGKAKGLPRDMAENHDHYAHGAPKRKKK